MIDLFKRSLLPLYGRKFIVFLFTLIVWTIGAPWGQGISGATEFMTANDFFPNPTWFISLLAIFMTGQIVDNFTSKVSDSERAASLSTFDYFKLKTKEILEPQPFLIWLIVALFFILTYVDGETFFYLSCTYMGVNSAEAIVTNFRGLIPGLNNQTSPAAFSQGTSATPVTTVTVPMPSAGKPL